MAIPEVSIIIPAYNAESTLEQALRSALAQTVNDHEVIVVDDGSADRTAHIARSTGDARVRVLAGPNGGVARARNRGIHEARGQFIAFLDADDVWLPTKIERQITSLNSQPEAGMCFTAAMRIGADNRLLDEIPARTYHDYCAALLLNSVIISGSCSSGMVRRVLALDVGGFDPSFSQCADWDFWLRLSRVTHFVSIPDPLVRYRTSSGNMSSNVSLLERDTFGVLDKFFSDPSSEPYLSLRSRSYSNHWMICSGSYLHAWQVRDSLRCLLHGLAARPASIRRPLGMPFRWISRLMSSSTDLA